MMRLSDTIPVWPPVREQSDAVRKCELAAKLDTIARHLSQKRPKSFPITTTKPTSAEWRTGKWVLKRDRSSYAEDVKLPHDIAVLDKDMRNLFLNHRYHWLAQEYMPWLRDVGEWRVIVIGGRVERVIFTNPGPTGDIDFILVEHFNSLGHIL